MKKIILGLTSLATLAFLTACQTNTPTNSESDDTLKATLVVQFEDKIDSQEVTFEQDDTVMDILEDYHEVEEEAGMVTEIDGVSQDASKNTYWMYNVNDELAPKGAKEMTVSDGDTIEFYLESFD